MAKAPTPATMCIIGPRSIETPDRAKKRHRSRPIVSPDQAETDLGFELRRLGLVRSALRTAAASPRNEIIGPIDSAAGTPPFFAALIQLSSWHGRCPSSSGGYEPRERGGALMSKQEETTPYGMENSRMIPMGIVVLAALIFGPPEWAGDGGNGSENKPDRYYGFVNLGPYDTEEDLGLLGSSTLGFQLAGGFGHRMNRVFAGEVELGLVGREHEVRSDLWPEEVNDPTLGIYWLSYSIVARFPARKVAPFVAFGIGSGQAHLEIVSDDYPDSPILEIDDDHGVLFHYRAGLEVALGKKNWLGFELRKIVFEADLGAFTDGETDIGGTGALFTYRRTF
jgi:hypothetical protein